MLPRVLAPSHFPQLLRFAKRPALPSRLSLARGPAGDRSFCSTSVVGKLSDQELLERSKKVLADKANPQEVADRLIKLDAIVYPSPRALFRVELEAEGKSTQGIIDKFNSLDPKRRQYFEHLIEEAKQKDEDERRHLKSLLSQKQRAELKAKGYEFQRVKIAGGSTAWSKFLREYNAKHPMPKDVSSQEHFSRTMQLASAAYKAQREQK